MRRAPSSPAGTAGFAVLGALDHDDRAARVEPDAAPRVVARAGPAGRARHVEALGDGGVAGAEGDVVDPKAHLSPAGLSHPVRSSCYGGPVPSAPSSSPAGRRRHARALFRRALLRRHVHAPLPAPVGRTTARRSSITARATARGRTGSTRRSSPGDVNAILDFRFSPSPKLDWYFDHHVSAFAAPGDREAYELGVARRARQRGQRRMFHDGAYTLGDEAHRRRRRDALRRSTRRRPRSSCAGPT